MLAGAQRTSKPHSRDDVICSLKHSAQKGRSVYTAGYNGSSVCMAADDAKSMTKSGRNHRAQRKQQALSRDRLT